MKTEINFTVLKISYGSANPEIQKLLKKTIDEKIVLEGLVHQFILTKDDNEIKDENELKKFLTTKKLGDLLGTIVNDIIHKEFRKAGHKEYINLYKINWIEYFTDYTKQHYHMDLK